MQRCTTELAALLYLLRVLRQLVPPTVPHLGAPCCDASAQGDRGGACSASDGCSCNDLLGLPRVALLFLSRGALYHEALWAAWFASVEGLLPITYLKVLHICPNGCACPAAFAQVRKHPYALACRTTDTSV